jgi:hypothetical protein
MFKFDNKKQSIPFDKLFQLVSPEEFVTVFNSELAQTKAFILSFSPRRKYVQKVLRLLDTQESNENNLMNRSSFVICEYLNRCQESDFNINFVQTVDKEIGNMIAGYENSHGLRSLRKKFIFKHPKEVQMAQEMEKEALKNENKKTKSRFIRSYYG